MKNRKYFLAALAAALMLACLIPSTFAQSVSDASKLAVVSSDGSAVKWSVNVPFSNLTLIVSAPGGAVIRREFGSGVSPDFTAASIGAAALADGQYSYELRLTPGSINGVRLKTRKPGDPDAAGTPEGRAADQTGNKFVQSGSFSVHGGRVFVGAPEEGIEPVSIRSVGKFSGQSKDTLGVPVPNDVVTADDSIIQGSQCVGLDCVNNESFGFDTVRLKENNTRLAFVDTSTSAGFATRDWRLRANDSGSGGKNAFFIDDMGDASTGSDIPVSSPVTVTAGAPTNSFVIDSSGRIGLRTSTPGLDIHVLTNDTPAIRLDQSGQSFTAQTWDIGANEANFFVRDLTGGSRLPFRIRPGAPTSSVDIGADGSVSFAKGIKLPPLDNNGVPTGTPVDQTAVLSPLGPNYSTHVMGAIGTVDESSTAIVDLDNANGVSVKTGSAGTVTMRYNISPNSNFFANGTAQSVFKVRFRDSDGSGAAARVVVITHLTNVNTGADMGGPIFDSNTQASTGLAFATATVWLYRLGAALTRSIKAGVSALPSSE